MGVWDWQTYFYFMTALIISYPFLKKYDKSKKKSIYLIIALLPTFALLALRGETVGRDLPQYSRHVISAMSGNNFITWNFFQEPLFALVYKISAMLGGTRAFIIITSLLEYCFLFIGLSVLHKKEISIVLPFYLLYGFVVIRSFSMISNAVAIASCFCAYTYLLDDDNGAKKKYWLFTFIAILLHNTAILNIPIYFYCLPNQSSKKAIKRRINFIKIATLIAMIGFCYLLSRGSFNYLFATISDGSYSRLQVGEVTFGLGNIITRLPIIFLVMSIYKQIKQRNKGMFEPFIYLMVFDLIIAQLKYMSQDFERFTYLSGLFIVFLSVPMFKVYNFKTRGLLKVLMPIVIILYITFNIYRWAVIGNYGIMPYYLWS